MLTPPVPLTSPSPAPYSNCIPNKLNAPISVVIWILTGYFIYSAVILFITWGAILTQVYTTWTQSRSLAAMVNQVHHRLAVPVSPTTSDLRFRVANTKDGRGLSHHCGSINLRNCSYFSTSRFRQSTTVSRAVPGKSLSIAEMEEVPSELLMPGDIVAVSPGKALLI